MELYDFYTGRAFEAYHYFGAHETEQGFLFRTYAPGAEQVLLIGEWNQWKGQKMEQKGRSGVYELCTADAQPGMMYKYKIFGADGSERDHCDPYGFQMELRPGTASIVTAASRYHFSDEKWMQQQNKGFDGPMNIYEVHLGSWKRKEDGSWYSYEELAPVLAEYAKENGYNYIELMPLSEHPADCSWGYQNTGFFAPTSRYGTPDSLRKLVNTCHEMGVGVLLDFVPVHFALDDYGLKQYDGTALYEYPHADVGESEWGSCNFMHSRGEVCSFLQSCAHYWLEEFHFDGLRMDAVSRLLYWQGDPARGVNHNAVRFLQRMNAGLRLLHPRAILIAEDSTDYPKVTAPVEYGGLGFDYKWDLGWMNDTLDYFKKTPEQRRSVYHQLTFSMMYFYQEHYLLPLSHDENVHGKATVLQKMFGAYEQKFPQARAFYLYMMMHPGKKLNFMGAEFGQLREWDEAREQDWPVCRYPVHDAFLHYIRELNHLYQTHDAFWRGEYNPAHFSWLDCASEADCTYTMLRAGAREKLVAVFHFSDESQPGYRLLMPGAGRLRLLLHSDWQRFGGDEEERSIRLKTGKKNELTLDLPPFSAQLFLWEETPLS